MSTAIGATVGLVEMGIDAGTSAGSTIFQQQVFNDLIQELSYLRPFKLIIWGQKLNGSFQAFKNSWRKVAGLMRCSGWAFQQLMQAGRLNMDDVLLDISITRNMEGLRKCYRAVGCLGVGNRYL